MEAFSALLALCVGNSPVTSEFPTQRPVMWSFDVFFDLNLNEQTVNNRNAGDLICHHAHYDITVLGLGFPCELAVAKTKWFRQFPHSAFVRGPGSPAFEERKCAAMGATGERSAGRPPYPEWHVYWFLLISIRDIKLCNNFTYRVTTDDNHLQKPTILSSMICRYTGHQQ